MNTDNKYYIVTMYRWGDKDLRSYVLGVYDDLELATKEGEIERTFRGNKYSPEIVHMQLNVSEGGTIHKSFKNNKNSNNSSGIPSAASPDNSPYYYQSEFFDWCP